MQKKWMGISVAIAAAVWIGFKAEPLQITPLSAVSSSKPSEPIKLSNPSPESVEQRALLDNAAVQQYLLQQSEKRALQDYFNHPDNDTEQAKKIWLQIEKAEAEGGVLAFEALHLKMAWLEKNSVDRTAFEAASKDLVAHYHAKSAVAAEQYNPENTPEFKAYKTQELKIIQEINNLETIPKGLTREAYLREKLLAARIAAYGEADTEKD